MELTPGPELCGFAWTEISKSVAIQKLIIVYVHIRAATNFSELSAEGKVWEVILELFVEKKMAGLLQLNAIYRHDVYDRSYTDEAPVSRLVVSRSKVDFGTYN